MATDLSTDTSGATTVDGRGGTVPRSLGEVTDDEWLELGEEAFGMDVERSRA